MNRETRLPKQRSVADSTEKGRLCQVGRRHGGVEKATPISMGHQIGQIRVVKGFDEKGGSMVLVCKPDANKHEKSGAGAPQVL